MCQMTSFVRGITADVEPHAADLADTLPWMCPNDTGISGEAPEPSGPTDIFYWNNIGAKPKSSTPARTWSHVVSAINSVNIIIGQKLAAPTWAMH